MGYLTENRLSNIIDLPISLASSLLQMGDWLVIGSIRIQQPMRLTFTVLDLQILTSTVNISNLDSTNLIYGNFGIVYVVLQKDYNGGSPGASAGLDSVVATGLGQNSRDITNPVIITDPGTYTWIIANNTQASSSPTPAIPTSTAINFEVAATGSARLELSFS